MPHFQVDDCFSDSKEVVAIPRRIRAEAVGVWTLCGSWSANKLTDGFVPDEIVKSLGGRPAIVSALIDDAKLWERVSGGILVRNWSKWQRTRAQVLAYRESEADRKRNQRAAKKALDSSGNGETSATRPGGTQSGQGDVSRPEYRRESRSTKPLPVPVTETSGGEVTTVSGEPSSTCPKHPYGTPNPCSACAIARRKADEWQSAKTLAAVNRRQALLTAIAECDECDDAGWAVDDESDAVFKCQHNSATRKVNR